MNALPLTEVLLLSRGRKLETTIRGDQGASAIHHARQRHPHCTILNVRKWVTRACTGTGGGMGGGNNGGFN